MFICKRIKALEKTVSELRTENRHLRKKIFDHNREHIEDVRRLRYMIEDGLRLQPKSEKN